MIKRTIISIFILILASMICIATQQSLGVFSQDDSIYLRQNCQNSTYSNITQIIYPNSSDAISSAAVMTKEGDDYYYVFSSTGAIGDYLVYGHCDESRALLNWVYDFEITPNGQKPTTAQSVIYFILLLISIIILSFLVFLDFSMDVTRFEKDSITGRIIGINWKHHYKWFLWTMTYACLVWLMSLGYSISENLLYDSMLTGFFKSIYYILLSAALPLLIAFIILAVVSYTIDKRMQSLLDRGLQP